MDENIVTGNTPNADEEIVLDFDDNVDVTALQEQNKRLYARAKKAEGFTQQPDGSWVKLQKPQNQQQFTNAEQKPYNILEDDVADLILGGYSKDETKFILANGGRKALDDKDSFVAVAIESKRQQQRTEQAVSETSTNGYTAPGGKSHTEEQMRNMPLEELAKILPQA